MYTEITDKNLFLKTRREKPRSKSEYKFDRVPECARKGSRMSRSSPDFHHRGARHLHLHSMRKLKLPTDGTDDELKRAALRIFPADYVKKMEKAEIKRLEVRLWEWFEPRDTFTQEAIQAFADELGISQCWMHHFGDLEVNYKGTKFVLETAYFLDDEGVFQF